jgi:hypothetical protein
MRRNDGDQISLNVLSTDICNGENDNERNGTDARKKKVCSEN